MNLMNMITINELAWTQEVTKKQQQNGCNVCIWEPRHDRGAKAAKAEDWW